MAGLRIELFGGPIARVGTETITKFETRKTGLLLGVLAFEPGRTWNRNAVCEILWPFEDPEISRTRLRQAVAALRRALGSVADLLLADRVDLRFDGAEVTSDVQEFERVLRTARSESGEAQARCFSRAVALYREDFLPGYLEDWAGVRREHYRSEHRNALEGMMRGFASVDLRRDAVEAGLAYLRIDPLNEVVGREVMNLYAAEGLIANAQRVYRDLEAALKVQIGVEPSEETRALLERIRTAVPREVTPTLAQAKSVEAESLLAPPLPEVAGPIFGREPELERLTELLAPDSSTRLVTLTGIGGIGKTRLALETACLLREPYRGLAWAVLLDSVADSANLAAHILDLSGLKRSGPADPLDQLAERIGQARALLVLDNFEQLVPDGADLVATLLSRCPNLRLLVTSRIQLLIGAEREVALGPLSLPGADGEPEASPSVRLFLERTRVLRPDFPYSEAVSILCERLEGIPLALTLAASRSQVLSAEQMLEQIDRRLDFLSGRRRDVPQRHRTMRATIEWSVRDLSEDLRRFFVALSVFRGGWDLEAAESVAGRYVADPVEALQELRDRSLVFVTESAAGLRFGMFETIREYAVELREGVEDLERHVEYMATLAQRGDDELRGQGQGTWLQIFDINRPNALAALEYACEHRPETAARIVGSYWMYWHIRGRYHEGREWGMRVVAAYNPDPPTDVLARALNGLGVMHNRCSDIDASRAALRKSAETFRALGDDERMAGAYNNLGNLEFEAGRYEEALECQQKALEVFRRFGDERSIAMTTANMGNVTAARKDFSAAEAYLQAALAVNRATNNRHWEANNLTSLGIVALFMNDLDAADERLSKSLELKRELNQTIGIAITQNYRARIAVKRHRLDEAKETILDSLSLLGSIEAIAPLADAIELVGIVAIAEDRWADAVAFDAAADGLRERHALPLHYLVQDEVAARRKETRIAVGDDLYNRQWTVGRLWTPPQAVAQARGSLVRSESDAD
ncbi:MAG TPA: tetratricopeptide repeat protein [Fimbriimonadaceae bacterium]|nr:tetratricopeptide repeat protein [Fimbriimonadaceae bacterium]HRJ96445.1 tetratricopeptide repeat protein [Fimbriimonadaceae bacterium]